VLGVIAGTTSAAVADPAADLNNLGNFSKEISYGPVR
jgi:hypothetical protein